MLPFQLKKFISQFLMPMPLVCECFLLGWVLTRFTKYKKTGKCFYLLAFTLFLLFGYGFGRTYLYNLERRYPPFDPTPEECEALRGAPVVVLGQGMPIKSDLPLRYQNNPVFERRLFEGVRCAKLIPESRLIVSMAGEASDSVKQTFLNGYMLQVNFPTNRVFMFTTARDTTEEAKLAKNCLNALLPYCVIESSRHPTNALMNSRTNELLPALMNSRTNELANFRTLELPRRGVASSEAGSNFRTNVLSSSRSQNFRTLELSNFRTNVLILTTSASHLPRAMKIFQKQGLNPVASPCDYSELEPPEFKLRWPYLPLPTGSGFETSQRALYEWLGAIYELIR
jgi:uncharacterized SAM-binding protein YcdF (DUF218 family)